MAWGGFGASGFGLENKVWGLGLRVRMWACEPV